ncbi:TIGR01841 family phasin [Colwellia psychrerythraea]|uniref:Phasin family protein n=1 Tax=Colwellia psychrerythraea TaxID=28229 RepID=A0A099KYK1_COLPS|nr:TIGR01841 family phasin [Colwellia psychrerythraea]KGJ95626.1 phasin family protein [Colwellia psychrerythraea]
MFNQFTELFQTSLTPIEKLVELNISTASTVAHQQGLLVASLIDDSISFSQHIPVTTDITELVAQQSKFNTDVQSQLTEAIKQTSETLSKAQKNAETIFGESLLVFTTQVNKASTEEQALVPKALIKENSQATREVVVKAKPKAAIKAESKPAVKAKPKAAVKAKPKAVVKAKPKAAVKAKPKAEVEAKPKAAVKAKPKAEVKAKPKAVVEAKPKAVVEAKPKAEVKAEPKIEVKTAANK